MSRWLRKSAGAALGMLSLLAMGTVARGQSAAADGPHVHVQMVVPEAALEAGGDSEAGLYFKMEPGWHVYWLNAGDAGEPPRMHWTLPEGITAGELRFPAPKRLPNGPLMDFGYENEVLFPLTLHVGRGAKPGAAVLAAKASWLVCREVCIPGKAELQVSRPVVSAAAASPAAGSGAGQVAADAEIFSRLGNREPVTLPTGSSVRFQPTATGYRLAIVTGRRETEAQFFPADQGVISNPAAQRAEPVADGVVLELVKDPNATAGSGPGVSQLRGVVELSGGRAYGIDAKPGAVAAAVPAAGAGASFAGVAQSAGLAFLGGVILNLMPCVFPVLFLKGLSLVNSSGDERSQLRAHGLVYTAGIVASFWLLVGLLLGLKAAGATLGWGFQFQSPVFVALMAGLLFFMGLSLAGQFDVGLTLTSAGSGLAARQGYSGSFFTGVLAVIVATPCTAPLMATAIGYALAQTAWVTFAIFTALGLGLAAPYLLLTLRPGWTRVLPRPGVWMDLVKQATAVPVFLTVIWLVWVLGRTRGAEGVAAVLGMFLLLAVAGWVLGRYPARRGPAVVAGLVVAAAIAVAVYGVVTIASPVGVAAETNAGGETWEPWSAAKVAQYQAGGRPVFVDFTASWCLSCQVNERVALRTSAVQAAFAAHHVALLKADWTEHDDAITEALTAMGRSGVPAYALYRPGVAEPTMLPEVLTPGIVVEAVGKAGGQ